MKKITRSITSLIVSLLVISLFGNMVVLASSNNNGVEAFVARLYNICLERDYDQAGLESWSELLVSGATDGGSVARGFFTSDEYVNVVADDEAQYLTKLYRVFFNREPDEGGFSGWIVKLDGSMAARNSVMNGFISSAEWTNTCEAYGILSGAENVNNAATSGTDGISVFVNSLYEGCLGRAADEGGFIAWSQMLSNREITGRDAAYGFFYSAEFTNKYATLSTSEKVETFYQVFFNRAADVDGLNYWCDVINSGASFDVMFDGFSASQEFAKKCSDCGILYSMDESTAPAPQEEVSAPVVEVVEPVAVTVNQCSDRFNSNAVVTITVDLGNGETREVTGYFDYEAEEEILDCLNADREFAGLEPLVMTDDFRDAARLRAVELVCSPSHTRPNGESCFTAIPWNNCGGENIAAGFETGADFNYQWYNSTKHRENMLNENYKFVGIGVFVCEGSEYYEYGAESFSG